MNDAKKQELENLRQYNLSLETTVIKISQLEQRNISTDSECDC